MSLTFGSIMHSAGIDPDDALVIRHAYVPEHEDGAAGINADSSDVDILHYTREQPASTRQFPTVPPRTWVVFIPEGGGRARLWSVLENQGETSNDGYLRWFDLHESEQLADLRKRLVIEWRSPRKWHIKATTAAGYSVMEIADSQPEQFPGFDWLVLDYAQLQAVMREHRYEAWRTALASVSGIYLITDMRNGRHYVGKADGAERIRKRWSDYAANGHGGNIELRNADPKTFQFSLLRVFDPATPSREIDEAESHFKNALDTRKHGLNRN